MSERLILEGTLQEKKMERMKLATKAQGLIRSIKMIIQPAPVTPLGELRTGEALELMAELDRVKRRYDRLSAEIGEIKKELGVDED
ncbi:MAG: hypothetical protein JRJ66_02165 [Deltaproteobacteria bacterium]|nr:hypothetical protein [Deltaproteobacteria bacterium]